MVIELLKHKIVFLDTAPLIYFMEGHSQYQPVLEQIFKLNDEGHFQFITSCITLLEVLVKPLKEKKHKTANQYRQILSSAAGLEIVDISTTISIRAASYRADFNLRTPDAIQIATAVEQKADFFLTNDAQLKTLKFIKVLTVSELTT